LDYQNITLTKHDRKLLLKCTDGQQPIPSSKLH